MAKLNDYYERTAASDAHIIAMSACAHLPTFQILIIVPVLDPTLKLEYFKKHWGLELLEEVKSTVKVMVCSYIFRFLHLVDKSCSLSSGTNVFIATLSRRTYQRTLRKHGNHAVTTQMTRSLSRRPQTQRILIIRGWWNGMHTFKHTRLFLKAWELSAGGGYVIYSSVILMMSYISS